MPKASKVLKENKAKNTKNAKKEEVEEEEDPVLAALTAKTSGKKGPTLIAKVEKKVEAAVKTEKKVEAPKVEKKVEPTKPLSEVELLRQRVLELERQAQEKAKKAQAPAPAAKSKKEEKFNPQPALTKQQQEEQAKLLEKFEREQKAWVEVKDNKRGKKDKKAEIQLIDLNILTIVSSLTVTQADRHIVVGDKGATLKQIIEVCGSGLKIELPPRPAQKLEKPGEVPMKIEFEGTEAQVAQAKKIITELTTKGYSADLTPDTTEARLRIDPADRSKIVGVNGAYMKKIIEKTGVTINMPKRDEANSDNIVRIVGTAQGVQEAKEAIKSLVLDGFSSLTHDDFEKINVDFPIASRKYLLISYNKEGPLIHKIQDLTGCKLSFPTQADKAQIIIVGPSTKVYTAAAYLKQVTEKLQQPVADVWLPGFESNDFTANELW
eukprot:UN03005